MTEYSSDIIMVPRKDKGSRSCIKFQTAQKAADTSNCLKSIVRSLQIWNKKIPLCTKKVLP